MLVYCATHVESGRRYVGMTSKTLARRRQQHLRQAKGRARGCAYFWAALRKYGSDAFTWAVVATVDSRQAAADMERAYIREWDTTNPAAGFNLTEGGNGPTEASITEMARTLRGREKSQQHRENIASGRLGISPPNKGKKRAQTSIDKSAAGLRRYMADPAIRARARVKQLAVWRDLHETRATIGDKAKARWADPVERKRMLGWDHDSVVAAVRAYKQQHPGLNKGNPRRAIPSHSALMESVIAGGFEFTGRAFGVSGVTIKSWLARSIA